MRNILLGLLIFSATPAFADEIWIPHTNTQIDLDTFKASLSQSQLVVVGEEHYDPEIVAVEASIVEQLSKAGPTTLGWEFLNLVDAEQVASTVTLLKAGQLSAEQALNVFYPNDGAVEYKALFETIAKTDVQLIPTNLTRDQKSPVTANGIQAALPGTVPPRIRDGFGRLP